jgi:hypothetical protein
MLEPHAARTGRAAGIKLQYTGPGGGRNSISTAANGEQPALSLFGHELLAAHPEILLAAHEMIEKPPEPVPPPAAAASSSASAGFSSGSFGTFSSGRGGPSAKGGRSAVSAVVAVNTLRLCGRVTANCQHLCGGASRSMLTVAQSLRHEHDSVTAVLVIFI